MIAIANSIMFGFGVGIAIASIIFHLSYSDDMTCEFKRGFVAGYNQAGVVNPKVIEKWEKAK